MASSVSTDPGPGLFSTVPGPGPLWSNIASVWSRYICWSGLGLCVAFALLFCLFHMNHTSHQPQKKKIIDITASMVRIFYVVKRQVHVCDIFNVKKLENSNLMQASSP